MNARIKAAVSLASFLTFYGCASTNEPAATATATPAQPMTGEEMRQAFVGKTVEGRLSTGERFQAYNAEDGTAAIVILASGKSYPGAGKWEVKGDQFCGSWNNPDWKPFCYTYVKKDSVYVGTPQLAGISKVTISKLTDGNIYNLK